MQRRYRVLRTRRGHLLWFPERQPVTPAVLPPTRRRHPGHLPPHHRRGHLLQVPPPQRGPVPPLARQHRNKARGLHRHHGHLLWFQPAPPPPPPSTGPVLSAGPGRWKWTAGGARNG
jgi:hypothetical protein